MNRKILCIAVAILLISSMGYTQTTLPANKKTSTKTTETKKTAVDKNKQDQLRQEEANQKLLKEQELQAEIAEKQRLADLEAAQKTNDLIAVKRMSYDTVGKDEYYKNYFKDSLRAISDLPQVADFGYGFAGVPIFKLAKANNQGDKIIEMTGKFSYIEKRVNPDFWGDGKTVSGEFTLTNNYELTREINYKKEPDSTSSSGSIELSGKSGPQGNMSRYTYDSYLEQQYFNNPAFWFVEPQLYWKSSTTALSDYVETTKEGKTINHYQAFDLGVFSGVGLGKMCPSATFDRVNDFVLVLYNFNYLPRKLTITEQKQLMEIMNNNWNIQLEVDLALQELKNMGLLTREISVEVRRYLEEVVELSAGYTEHGKEIRIGLHYMITTGKVTYKDIDLPLQFGLWFKTAYQWDKLTVTPYTGIYNMFSPYMLFLVTGAMSEYRESKELKYYVNNDINWAMYKQEESKYNPQTEQYESSKKMKSFATQNLTIGANYLLTNLVSATAEVFLTNELHTKPKYGLNLALNFGSLTVGSAQKDDNTTTKPKDPVGEKE